MIVLETARMLFRPHETADLEAFCVMEQDAEVRRYVGGAPRTREAAEARFHSLLQVPADDRLRMWATVLKPNGAYIGRCGLYPHCEGEHVLDGEAVLGFYLARPFWGQGLATEAGAAFVAWGFDVLGLRRLVTAVEDGNAGSLRVVRKLGFALLWTEVGPRTFHHFGLGNPRLSERET